jgi:hypothetical protein
MRAVHCASVRTGCVEPAPPPHYTVAGRSSVSLTQSQLHGGPGPSIPCTRARHSRTHHRTLCAVHGLCTSDLNKISKYNFFPNCRESKRHWETKTETIATTTKLASSNRFWRCHIAIGIAVFFDLVLRPVFWRTQRFENWIVSVLRWKRGRKFLCWVHYKEITSATDWRKQMHLPKHHVI